MLHRRFVFAAAGLMVFGALATQCGSPKPTAPPASADPALLGDLKPVVSVKELMQNEIDPIADYIFDAVGTSVTVQGRKEILPTSDDDWEKVRIGAVTLAEAVNLLKIPRPFAPAGDLNVSDGPDAPELSPEAINRKVHADLAKWNGYAEALRAIALDVMDIVKRKDVSALDEAGGKLDKACENCHLEYWYPNDRKIIAEILAKDRQKAEAEKKANR